MRESSDDMLAVVRGYRHERDRLRLRTTGWLIALVCTLVLAIAAATDLPRILAYIIGGG